MNKIALMSDLTAEEDFRSLVYDDATGKTLEPGDTLQGNPTIAVGWNISGLPCTQELGQIILGYWVDRMWTAILAQIPWVANLPDPVQRALTDMTFNMRGVAQLLTFNTFLALLQKGEYGAAADDLGTTLWFKQVKSRGQRIQALVRQGAAT